MALCECVCAHVCELNHHNSNKSTKVRRYSGLFSQTELDDIIKWEIVIFPAL